LAEVLQSTDPSLQCRARSAHRSSLARVTAGSILSISPGESNTLQIDAAPPVAYQCFASSVWCCLLERLTTPLLLSIIACTDTPRGARSVGNPQLDSKPRLTHCGCKGLNRVVARCTPYPVATDLPSRHPN